MTVDTIDERETGSLHRLFLARVARTPEAPAYRWFDRAGGRWAAYSWRETAAQVGRWRAALAGEGLSPGARVALALKNGIEWVCFEQAALSLGLVVVPLYPDDRPENLAYICRDAGVELLLLPDRGRWQRLAPSLADLPRLQRVVVPGEGESGHPLVRYSGRWLPQGAESWVAEEMAPDDLATLVYTSGTTGRPKGVMLSHRNILSNVFAGLSVVEVFPSDRFLSFLPLAHMLERTAGYYLPMAAGAEVAFARSIPQLGQDMTAVRPTALISVPRIYETAYGRIIRQLEAAAPWRQRLFRAAVDVGWHRFEWRQGRRGWGPRLLFAPVLQRLVGSRVLARLGGNVRLAVSGGARLEPELARTFIGLGLNLIQGYGLTEASPVISVNRPADNRPAGIGPPLAGVEVRVDDRGELWVRGPNVMLGYWRDQAATRAMIDEAGWLHTGDTVRQRRDGHLEITGRIKEILVLSNGEKVPPADMEAAIALDPLFEQVMVLGEGRPFLSALVTLDRETWMSLAAREGIPWDEASLRRKETGALLVRRVAQRLSAFPGYARIRRLHASLEPWTVEEGLLTPTLKLRRAEVLKRHAAVVADFYREPRTASVEAVR